MKKIKTRYYISMVLSILCLFMIIDTVIVFPEDLYAILMGQFINIPLGIVSLITSLVIQKKEANEEKWKTSIIVIGIILGLITSILSIVLFKIGMTLR